MTDQQPPPTDQELDEFEELGRWYDPRTSMTEQWADDLGSAVVRLVAEVRRLRKVVESARSTSDTIDASPQRSPSSGGAANAWGRAIARAAAWFVIVAVVIALVVAFPTLLAVIVVGGLLWWAIAVLVRTSKTRGDGQA